MRWTWGGRGTGAIETRWDVGVGFVGVGGIGEVVQLQ